MKKPKILNGLEKLLFTTVLAGALASPMKGQERTAAEIAGNPCNQPNIHFLEGREIYDYYGSGDSDNNGVINFEDAELIRTTDQSGNDRADVNGDGVINLDDANLIQYFSEGSLNHLPGHWNELVRSEKIDWFEKMLAIDKTNERAYSSTTFNCVDFAMSCEFNFFGAENFENYFYFDRFTEQGNHNARFNIPLYTVSTRVTVGNSGLGTETDGHRIIGFLAGPESDEKYQEDPTDFTQWVFYEPQTDARVYPGDWSMNENEYARIRWFGYFPDYNLFNPLGLISFDLKNGEADTISWQPYYLLTQNPLLDDEAPTWTTSTSQTIPYDRNKTVEEIVQEYIPTNISDNKDTIPTFTYDYTTNKTEDGSCTDFSYDILINSRVEDNQNNFQTDSITISVRDNEPPTMTVPADETISFYQGLDTDSIINANNASDMTDNSGAEPVYTKTASSEQTQNGSCSDVDFKYYVDYSAEDVCGNKTEKTQTFTIRDNEAPTYTTPRDTTIKEGSSMEPDSIGWPTNLYDNSGLPVNTGYTDEVVEENESERRTKRTWDVSDVCGNEVSSEQYITEQKPNVIYNKTLEDFVNLYPNPSNGLLNLEYNLQNPGKVHTEIYDASGRLMDSMTDEGFTGENKLELDVSNLKSGFYILNFTQDGKTSTKKFIKK